MDYTVYLDLCVPKHSFVFHSPLVNLNENASLIVLFSGETIFKYRLLIFKFNRLKDKTDAASRTFPCE